MPRHPVGRHLRERLRRRRDRVAGLAALFAVSVALLVLLSVS